MLFFPVIFTFILECNELLKTPIKFHCFMKQIQTSFLVLYVLLDFWDVQNIVTTYKYSLMKSYMFFDTN